MAQPKAPTIGTRVNVMIKPSSDAKESVELDYRVLIPGNFTRSEPGMHKDGDGSLQQRRIREIKNKGDFKRVLDDLNPKLKLTVANKLSDDPEAQMDVELDIKDMKDFHPDEIVKSVKPLQELMAARNRLKQLKLLVLKDPNVRKGIEKVLEEGSSSIDDLMSKLAPADSGGGGN